MNMSLTLSSQLIVLLKEAMLLAFELRGDGFQLNGF